MGKSVVGPRTFTAVQQLLWYNCSPVCGLPTSNSIAGPIVTSSNRTYAACLTPRTAAGREAVTLADDWWLMYPQETLKHTQAGQVLSLIGVTGAHKVLYVSSKLTKMITWITASCNLMKLWTMPCRATQERWVMVENSNKAWCTGKGNGKPLHNSNPMNSMKMQNDMMLKMNSPGWNYCTVALISHASKVMLKFLQVKIQQYVTQELSDVQATFRKGRNQRSNCLHLLDHRKSKEIPEKKYIYFCFIDYAKVFDWITTNCRKLIKRWGYQTTLLTT